MRPLLILAGLFVFAGVVRAETGNELLANCLDQENNFTSGMCLGYIHGAIDSQVGIMNATKACFYNVPTSVTNQQAVDIVIKYMKDYPERRQVKGDTIVFNAMQEAFPCPK